VASVNHGTLTANGIRLHYIEQGCGDPVLFLHGFPEYSGAWGSVMADLGERFRAIAIDTRGINLSEGPSNVGGYAIGELVEDVRQAIAALGYRNIVLVGHDWGGFIAWELAIRHPESLDRLVIINAAHVGIFDQLLRQGGAQAHASRYMLAFRSSRGEELVSRDDFAAFRREILESARSSGNMNEEQAAEYLALWRRPECITAGLNYYRANKSGPPNGDDGEARDIADTIVSVPTLVIWGERDNYFTPENLDLLPKVVPDLIVRRYPENGHWIVHERPHEIAQLISAFAEGALVNDGRR
jgi:pimeloyl-ACP methyl ester carboxylesterase